MVLCIQHLKILGNAGERPNQGNSREYADSVKVGTISIGIPAFIFIVYSFRLFLDKLSALAVLCIKKPCLQMLFGKVNRVIIVKTYDKDTKKHIT